MILRPLTGYERIDRLHDRMVDLEQMLDRFLEEIESSRRSNRDR